MPRASSYTQTTTWPTGGELVGLDASDNVVNYTKAAIVDMLIGTFAAPPLTANSITAFAGSPTLAQGVGTGAWLLDGAASESLMCSFYLREPATSMSVDVVWAQWAAGTGDVDLRLRWQAWGDGETVSTNTESTVTDNVAGTDKVRVTTTLASGLTVAQGDIVSLIVDRLGAADTFNSDIGVVAIVPRLS